MAGLKPPLCSDLAISLDSVFQGFPKITVCLNCAPYSPEHGCVHAELLGFLEVLFPWHEHNLIDSYSFM